MQNPISEWSNEFAVAILNKSDYKSYVVNGIKYIDAILLTNKLNPPLSDLTNEFLETLPNILQNLLELSEIPQHELELIQNFLVKISDLIPWAATYDHPDLIHNLSPILRFQGESLFIFDSDFNHFRFQKAILFNFYQTEALGRILIRLKQVEKMPSYTHFDIFLTIFLQKAFKESLSENNRNFYLSQIFELGFNYFHFFFSTITNNFEDDLYLKMACIQFIKAAPDYKKTSLFLLDLFLTFASTNILSPNIELSKFCASLLSELSSVSIFAFHFRPSFDHLNQDELLMRPYLLSLLQKAFVNMGIDFSFLKSLWLKYSPNKHEQIETFVQNSFLSLPPPDLAQFIDFLGTLTQSTDGTKSAVYLLRYLLHCSLRFKEKNKNNFDGACRKFEINIIQSIFLISRYNELDECLQIIQSHANKCNNVRFNPTDDIVFDFIGKSNIALIYLQDQISNPNFVNKKENLSDTFVSFLSSDPNNPDLQKLISKYYISGHQKFDPVIFNFEYDPKIGIWPIIKPILKEVGLKPFPLQSEQILHKMLQNFQNISINSVYIECLSLFIRYHKDLKNNIIIFFDLLDYILSSDSNNDVNNNNDNNNDLNDKMRLCMQIVDCVIYNINKSIDPEKFLNLIQERYSKNCSRFYLKIIEGFCSKIEDSIDLEMFGLSHHFIINISLNNKDLESYKIEFNDKSIIIQCTRDHCAGYPVTLASRNIGFNPLNVTLLNEGKNIEMNTPLSHLTKQNYNEINPYTIKVIPQEENNDLESQMKKYPSFYLTSLNFQEKLLNSLYDPLFNKDPKYSEDAWSLLMYLPTAQSIINKINPYQYDSSGNPISLENEKINNEEFQNFVYETFKLQNTQFLLFKYRLQSLTKINNNPMLPKLLNNCHLEEIINNNEIISEILQLYLISFDECFNLDIYVKVIYILIDKKQPKNVHDLALRLLQLYVSKNEAKAFSLFDKLKKPLIHSLEEFQTFIKCRNIMAFLQTQPIDHQFIDMLFASKIPDNHKSKYLSMFFPNFSLKDSIFYLLNYSFIQDLFFYKLLDNTQEKIQNIKRINQINTNESKESNQSNKSNESNELNESKESNQSNKSNESNELNESDEQKRNTEIDECANEIHQLCDVLEKKLFRCRNEKYIQSNLKFLVENSNHYDRILNILSEIQTDRWNYSSDRFIASPEPGLLNLGSTCYLNSIFQVLYHIPRVREVMFQSKFDDDVGLSSLQHIFSELMLTEQNYVNTKRFIECWNGWYGSTIDTHEQQDAAEFFRLLLDTLPEETKNVFKGEAISKITSLPNADFPFEKETNEDFYLLPLPVKTTLENELYQSFQPEILENDNGYMIDEAHIKIDALKSFKIKHVPPVLAFHLSRFNYDKNSGKRLKINDYFPFPATLDLSKYDLPTPYYLFAIVFHRGDADHGHYLSAIRRFSDSNPDPTNLLSSSNNAINSNTDNNEKKSENNNNKINNNFNNNGNNERKNVNNEMLNENNEKKNDNNNNITINNESFVIFNDVEVNFEKGEDVIIEKSPETKGANAYILFYCNKEIKDQMLKPIKDMKSIVPEFIKNEIDAANNQFFNTRLAFSDQIFNFFCQYANPRQLRHFYLNIFCHSNRKAEALDFSNKVFTMNLKENLIQEYAKELLDSFPSVLSVIKSSCQEIADSLYCLLMNVFNNCPIENSFIILNNCIQQFPDFINSWLQYQRISIYIETFITKIYHEYLSNNSNKSDNSNITSLINEKRNLFKNWLIILLDSLKSLFDGKKSESFLNNIKLDPLINSISLILFKDQELSEQMESLLLLRKTIAQYPQHLSKFDELLKQCLIKNIFTYSQIQNATIILSLGEILSLFTYQLYTKVVDFNVISTQLMGKNISISLLLKEFSLTLYNDYKFIFSENFNGSSIKGLEARKIILNNSKTLILPFLVDFIIQNRLQAECLIYLLFSPDLASIPQSFIHSPFIKQYMMYSFLPPKPEDAFNNSKNLTDSNKSINSNNLTNSNDSINSSKSENSIDLTILNEEKENKERIFEEMRAMVRPAIEKLVNKGELDSLTRSFVFMGKILEKDLNSIEEIQLLFDAQPESTELLSILSSTEPDIYSDHVLSTFDTVVKQRQIFPILNLINKLSKEKLEILIAKPSFKQSYSLFESAMTSQYLIDFSEFLKVLYDNQFIDVLSSFVFLKFHNPKDDIIPIKQIHIVSEYLPKVFSNKFDETYELYFNFCKKYQNLNSSTKDLLTTEFNETLFFISSSLLSYLQFLLQDFPLLDPIYPLSYENTSFVNNNSSNSDNNSNNNNSNNSNSSNSNINLNMSTQEKKMKIKTIGQKLEKMMSGDILNNLHFISDDKTARQIIQLDFEFCKISHVLLKKISAIFSSKFKQHNFKNYYLSGLVSFLVFNLPIDVNKPIALKTENLLNDSLKAALVKNSLEAEFIFSIFNEVLNDEIKFPIYVDILRKVALTFSINVNVSGVNTKQFYKLILSKTKENDDDQLKTIQQKMAVNICNELIKLETSDDMRVPLMAELLVEIDQNLVLEFKPLAISFSKGLWNVSPEMKSISYKLGRV